MDLEHLSRINKVDAPPFLFTRILQKIENQKREAMSKSMAVSLGISFAVLLFINTMVFIENNAKTNSVENYAESIQLISNSSLYK